MLLSLGDRLGPYEVLAPLGAGGMGEVFLANDTRLGRWVALKRVTDTEVPGTAARARLLHEARAAASLNHPNIAGIYDVLDEAGQTIIVMEYVPGETLAALLDRGRPSHDDALSIATQLAQALVHAHAAGIVHRDLKPANVKVTPDGRVKILDFGLARIRDLMPGTAADPTVVLDGRIGSSNGTMAGTPAYMAPEQLLGHPADQRSDLYGFGVLMFQVLTGRLPFEGADLLSLALAVTSGPTPRPLELDANVPPRLDAIVSKAMTRDPAGRFQSARELLAALEDSTVPPAAAPRPVRWTAVWAFGLAGVVLAVLTVFGPAAWPRLRGPARWSPAGRAGIIAVMPFDNRTGDATRDYLAAGIAETLMTRLAALGAVTVVSAPSLREGRTLAADVRAAAKELGADLVLTGGVGQSGAHVHIDARLTRPDGTVVWGDTRESPGADFFAPCGALIETLAEALGLDATAGAGGRQRVTPPASAEAFVEYSRGREWLERQDEPRSTALAVAAFERAVQLDPSFARARAALGDALWQQFASTNDTATATRAREAVESAVSIDPDDPAVRLSLASVYRATGKAGLAALELRRAVELEPANDTAHRLLAQTLASLGRDAEAADEFRRALAIRPDYWRNHTALGAYLFHAARYREAVTEFRRATELQPGAVTAFANLGASYQALGENGPALAAFTHVLGLSPKDHVTISNVGTIHYTEGRYAEAVKAYQSACEIAPHRAEYFRNLGDAWLRLGNQTSASGAYGRAVDLATEQVHLNPQDARRLAQLAVYEAKLGRRNQAARHVTEAVSLQPGAAEVLYRASVVHALTGNAPRALTMLEGAIARGYSRDLARKDEDLASLRALPAFAALFEPSS